MCGEAGGGLSSRTWSMGPSPRVRGSLETGPSRGMPMGSIPACAGKPERAGRWLWAGGVHPRVCGEAIAKLVWFALVSGPSPRVRGSRSVASHGIKPSGSIPACAGKPSTSPGTPYTKTVHPRVCGEARMTSLVVLNEYGPSPRVRGSHAAAGSLTISQGSIPACAGKPSRPPVPLTR